MHPKWFLSLWYVWRKPCTYLVPTLTTCPNGLKRALTRPSNLGVPSGASKMISEPMVHLAQTIYLAPTQTPSPNGLKRDSTWPHHLGVPSFKSKMISDPMVRSAQTMHLSCVETNTISKWTKTSFHYLGVPFWCAQSNFHARGTFGANRAPILHQN